MRVSIRMIVLYSLISIVTGTGFVLLLQSNHIPANHRFLTALCFTFIFGLMLITDKLMQYQRSLKEAKRNLDEAQQLARLGSWERNLVTGKGYWSENHFRLFGISPGDSAPSMDDFFQLIHDADRKMAQETVYAAIKTGSSYEIQYHLANDAAYRVFLSRGKVSVDDAGTSLRIIGTVQDITEKQLQEQLREHLLEQMEMFIRRLSHDLKTPLTPLVALFPLIRAGASDERQREYIDICMRNVAYIKNLVAKTIHLARLSSASRPQFTLVDIQLKSAISYYIADMAEMIAAKGISINNLISPEIIVRADNSELGEVFHNLISNAVKFSPTNSVVHIDAASDQGVLTVTVMDNGIGLTPEEQDHIFDEFYKTDPSRHELGSSGLGLSICRRIIENHGGRIWAESAGTGSGTAIRFTLAAGGTA
jgi:signal transduction histidine kinase